MKRGGRVRKQKGKTVNRRKREETGINREVT
jgi:hypothetical protein